MKKARQPRGKAAAKTIAPEAVAIVPVDTGLRGKSVKELRSMCKERKISSKLWKSARQAELLKLLG